MEPKKQKTLTVKRVAEASGISVRTLRFYDEIDLVKPAFYGENGYRYYETEQLLLIQQILFYRELGFELSTIKQIVNEPNFDTEDALRKHRKFLSKKLKQTHQLIETIDDTLNILNGRKKVREEKLFLGFDPVKQKALEKEVETRWGTESRRFLEECHQRTSDWKELDYKIAQEDYHQLNEQLRDEIERSSTASDFSVQSLIQKHYELVCRFWTPDRNAYIGLGESYCDHPDFQKYYFGYHPDLAEFIRDAMAVYANNQLK